MRNAARILPGLAVLLVACVAAAREDTRTEPEKYYDSVRAKLDKAEPGWSWKEMQKKRAKLEDGDNSFTLLKRIFDKEKDLPPVPLDLCEERLPGEAMPFDAAVAFNDYTSKYKDALAIARMLADRPKGRHPIEYSKDFLGTLLPTAQSSRCLADLLAADAIVSAEWGEFDQAVMDLHAMVNLARSFGDDDAFLILQLVRMAIAANCQRTIQDVLSLGSATDAQLLKLQDQLLEGARTNLLADGLRFERATMYEAILVYQERFDFKTISALTGNGKVGDPEDERRFAEAKERYMPNAKHDLATHLVEMTKALEIAQGKTEDLLPAMSAYDAYFKQEYARPESIDKTFFTNLLAAPVHKLSISYMRWLSQMRTAAAGIACERYRLKNGRWPAKLDDLAPTFIAKIPEDPYTGKPLRFQKTPNGVVVYAIGADNKDDGGDVLGYHRWERQDGSTAIAKKENADIGFRLWNLDARKKSVKPLAKEP